MSFLDSVIDIGKGVFNFFTGNSIGANLAKTAITGYALNQVTKSINKENEVSKQQAPDPGVRLQVNPDPEYKIPVVYGEAVVGGAVTDAQLSADGTTMYYCLTLSEMTGATELGNGLASDFEFLDIYWDDNRIILGDNGYTAASFVDKAGQVGDSIGGQVDFYFFAGNSEKPKALNTFTNPNKKAYEVMLNWDSTYMMQDLVFAIVVVRYNATKGIKGLGKIKIKLRNSMSLPGDCLYDYMTNTRYGAGIDPAEIYTS